MEILCTISYREKNTFEVTNCDLEDGGTYGENRTVKIYTYASAPLTNRDAANFNAQYPTLTVKKTQVFHDRFIILDGKTAYHIGASIKDAGKKCFGISVLGDPGMVTDLLNRLTTV